MLWRKFSLYLKFGEVRTNARDPRERGNVPALGDKPSWKERRGGGDMAGGSAWSSPSSLHPAAVG